MANDKKGGGGRAKIPRSLPDLDKANEKIYDIANSLDSLQSKFDKVLQLNIEVKGVEELTELGKKMKEVDKRVEVGSMVNKKLAENLGKLAKSHLVLNDIQKKANKGLQDNRHSLEQYEKQLDVLDAKKKSGAKLTRAEKQEYDKLEIAMDSVTDSMINNMQTGAAAAKSQAKLDSAAKTVAVTLGSQLLGAIDKVGEALMSLAIDSVFFSFELLHKGIMKVYDLLERTTKATGQFNLSLGGTTEGLDATRKAAWGVEGQMRSLTGGELGIGLKMWEETSHAVGFLGGEFDKITTKATLAGRALGIGGQQAGELAHTWIQLGDGAKSINQNMVSVSDASNLAGVSVADFGKEVVGVKGMMAAFGKTNEKVFLRSMAFAKKLGVSMQSLAKFADMTDTFDSTAEAAAKMNTVFGTNINSMELMLEQDPSKRLEQVRSAMKSQGKTWTNMSIQERKYFAQTMQMSEEEAAGVMENNMTLEKFREKEAKAAKRKKNADEVIQAGLLKTAETLHNFGQSWDQVTAAIGRLLKPFLKVLGLAEDVNGKMSFGKRMSEVFGKLVGFIDKIGSNKKVQKVIQSVANDFGKIFKLITGKGPESDKMIDKIVDGISSGVVAVKGLYDWGKKFVETVFTKDNMETALTTFKFIADHIQGILGTFVALKGVMGAATVMGGLSEATRAIAGKAGLVAMAGLAGWELGRFVGSLQVGGKTIDEHVQDGMSSFDKFYESLGILPKILLNIATLGLAGAAEAALKFGKGTPGVSDKGTAEIEKRYAAQQEKDKNRPRNADGTIKLAAPATATPIAPSAATSQPNAASGSSSVSRSSTPIATANVGGKEMTLVAGDVYLDGNLVGRHLLRGAGTS